MSIADHFEQAPDARCVRDYDAGAARRQFTLSLVLVVALALAAATLGMAVRFDLPIMQGNATAVSTAAPPAYAGKL